VRIGIYAFLVIAAAFFLLPVYVMVLTSMKSMSELQLNGVLALPEAVRIETWRYAWAEACTGARCEGISAGFWNSVRILIPSVVLSVAIGAVTGYSLSLWKVKGANILFGLLLAGAFIPYQIFLLPLVRAFSAVGVQGTLISIVSVHVIFSLPLMTLIFRNAFSSVPNELFRAARMDGCGYWTIFWRVLLPMSGPIIAVAVILQVSGVWNDFLMGVIFAGQTNMPMTVQLNNLVNTEMGMPAHDVNMAATLMTALVPLAVYLLAGRLFERGIYAGAVKG